MTRIALVALLAGFVAAPALAIGTLEVTVSDRGPATPHTEEARRILALIASEDR